MGQLTVRNLPHEIVRALKIRAAKHGRSAEAEHRLLLEQTLRPDAEDFWSLADQLRAETAGTRQSDSAALLRPMRDDQMRDDQMRDDP